KGRLMVQFREPQWAVQASPSDVQAGLEAVLQRCRAAGVACLVNSTHPEAWWALADGVHLNAKDAAAVAAGERKVAAGALHSHDEDTAAAKGLDPNSREYAMTRRDAHLRPRRLVGVSAHSGQELATARLLQADFAVVGHVLDTPSHPGETPLGWEGFTQLALEAGLPVYAIGGQSSATLATAQQHGAHGI